MKKVLLLMIFIFCSVGVFGQGKDSSSHQMPFFSKFQLRQSFQIPEMQQSPALLELTIPATGSPNWLVDAAAGITLGRLSTGSFTSKLVGEFHRNTLVDSLQYNYQLGYNFSWFNSKNGNQFTPVWTGNLKYIRDVADSNHSIAATLNFTLYHSGRGRFNLARPAYIADEKYTYQFTPSLEVQYQQILISNQQATGAIVRPLLDLSGLFAINKKKVKGKAPQKLIELSANYVNRYAVVNSTGNREGYTKLLTTGLSYYLLNTNSASVSLGGSYNLGSDPLNGLKDQRFWQFCLQVQL
jgi:hypothetical protein